MFFSLLRVYLFTFYFLFSLQGSAAQQGAVYDELYDAVGNMRSEYVELYARYKNLSEAEKAKLSTQFRKDFHGDNTLHPIPRLMSESEVELLRKGVAQRGEAIRLFFQDHYSGKKNYLSAGIFPTGVLESIHSRTFEGSFAGEINPETISFIYGPDIIRGPDGSFFVIEDNHGFVGGLGDLITAREALFKRIPEYRNVLDIAHHPEQFYDELVTNFKSQRRNSGPVVMLGYSLGQTDDKEDIRLRSIMRERGVEIVTPYSKNQLEVQSDRLLLLKPLPSGRVSRQEVGFLFIHGEPLHYGMESPLYTDAARVLRAESLLDYYRLVDQDPKKLDREEKEWREHMLQKGKAAALRRAQELRSAISLVREGKQLAVILDKLVDADPYVEVPPIKNAKHVPNGLVELMAQGKVPSSYPPGVEIISDKEFYLYVEKIIRFYLKEEPILRNIPTESAAQHPERIDDFQKDRTPYVVKKVDGRGGKEVYIGEKMNAQSLRKLVAEMRAHPKDYIIQRKTTLSQFDGLIVDNRMLSYIGPKGFVISDIPWGRGQLIDGDGKVNLSGSGREVTIIPVRDPNFPDCNRLERGARARRLLVQ
jgi:uncharacterized circularly permuted ATP-grasp superfamily protein